MKRIETISKVTIAGSDIQHAACVTAGNWVFVNGIEATDYVHGLAPEVAGNPRLPLHGAPKHRREGDYICARLKALLAQAGTDFAHSVRLDQFYPTWKAVDPYHLARKAAFGDYIPPSTSVIMQELLTRNADIVSSLLAVVPGGNRDPQRVAPPKVTAPTWSGFVPAVKSGDFVFVAGQMSRGAENTPDPRAHVPPHSLWGGYEIRRQAEYIIEEKLKPALAASGSSPANAVKAQAYLRHVEDTAHFVEVWNAHFGARQCALTVVPTCDFGLVEGNLEINLLALADGAATKKQIIDCDIAQAMTFGAPAVRAGDLLLTSGLMALDDDGPIAAIAAGAEMPYFGIGARAQMRAILEAADRICRAAGTELANVARSQQYHTDLADFAPMCNAWRDRLGDVPLPYSAVRVPALCAPGVSVLVDLWIYAP